LFGEENEAMGGRKHVLPKKIIHKLGEAG